MRRIVPPETETDTVRMPIALIRNIQHALAEVPNTMLSRCTYETTARLKNVLDTYIRTGLSESFETTSFCLTDQPTCCPECGARTDTIEHHGDSLVDWCARCGCVFKVDLT